MKKVYYLTNKEECLSVGSSRIIAYKQIKLIEGIDANSCMIYNLSEPINDNDDATNDYIDSNVSGKAKKRHSGLIPHLTSNMDKTGYVVSASSEHVPRYHAHNALNSGDAEWATHNVNQFWFKVKCLEKVRVWKCIIAGRNRPGHELLSWNFAGSNAGINWSVLKDEYNYTIGSVAK